MTSAHEAARRHLAKAAARQKRRRKEDSNRETVSGYIMSEDEKD